MVKYITSHQDQNSTVKGNVTIILHNALCGAIVAKSKN